MTKPAFIACDDLRQIQVLARQGDDELRQVVPRHVIGNRWRQELRLINLPRSKMSAHVAKESDLPRKCHHYSDTLLVAKHLSRDGEFEDVSIDVRRGEVVVITGLVGSGRTELLETLFRVRRARQRRNPLRRPQMRVGFRSRRDPGRNCFDPGRPPGAWTLPDPANVRKHCDGDFATLLRRARSLARLGNRTRWRHDPRLEYQASGREC